MVKGQCQQCGQPKPPYTDCNPCRRDRERERYRNDPRWRADKIARATAAYRAAPEKKREYERARRSRPEQVEKERERGPRRYRETRLKWIEYLGGECRMCGSVEDLEFDHIDYRTKSFNVAKNWSRPWAVLKEELDKCQLLCATHHKEKTAGDRVLRQKRALMP